MIPLFKVNMSDTAPKAVEKTLMSGYIGQGPIVDKFEAQLASYLLSETTPVTVNSGTSALDLALGLIGVGEGDYVISTPQTCFATNSVILNRGAHIIWADVDSETGNIDPESVEDIVKSWKFQSRSNKDIKAIMAVNWAGRLCDYKSLKSHGIPVIEDAAHTWGMDHFSHERGDYVCYSFQAIKFLTTGDGGALITPKDKEEEARILRWYGLDRTKGESFRCTQNIKKVGFKYHMNDISATIGIENLRLSDEGALRHFSNAASLTNKLFHCTFIKTPPFSLSKCAYWIYTIILDGDINRDHFIKYLESNNIASSQVHFRNDKYDVTSKYRTELPGLDLFSERQLSIPNGWWLSEEDVSYIAKTIKKYKQ